MTDPADNEWISSDSLLSHRRVGTLSNRLLMVIANGDFDFDINCYIYYTSSHLHVNLFCRIVFYGIEAFI